MYSLEVRILGVEEIVEVGWLCTGMWEVVGDLGRNHKGRAFTTKLWGSKQRRDQCGGAQRQEPEDDELTRPGDTCRLMNDWLVVLLSLLGEVTIQFGSSSYSGGSFTRARGHTKINLTIEGEWD